MDAASLSLYTDEHLDAGTRTRVEKHIDVCSRCRSELEELRRLAALLADVLATPARTQQDRWQALARAKERVAAIHRPWGAWWELPASGLPVLYTALLVLLALAEAVSFGGLEEEALAVALSLGLI